MTFTKMDLDTIEFLIYLFEDMGFSVSNLEFENDYTASFLISNNGKYLRINCSCGSNAHSSSDEEIKHALELLL